MTKLHEGQAVMHNGTPLDEANVVMIMLHQRGGHPTNFLGLTENFHHEGVAYIAPAAYHNTWYPNRFLVARAANEPYLSSALTALDDLVQHVIANGIASEKIVLFGFSQGGCLALEYVARNPQRFGAVIGLSAGLIGTDDELTGYEGALDNTPVFMGCSDVDFHIPLQRVHDSAEIMSSLGAKVDARIYPNMGHTFNQDEFDAVNDMLRQLL